jgi:hypothetical protein
VVSDFENLFKQHIMNSTFSYSLNFVLLQDGISGFPKSCAQIVVEFIYQVYLKLF